MALPKVGGDVYICTPANNLCGHGFYQFSPEFFIGSSARRTAIDRIGLPDRDAVYLWRRAHVNGCSRRWTRRSASGR